MRDLLLSDVTNFTTLNEEMTITTPVQCYETITFTFEHMTFDDRDYLRIQSIQSSFANDEHPVQSYEVHALASGQLEYDRYFENSKKVQAFMLKEIFKHLDYVFAHLNITKKLKEILIPNDPRFFTITDSRLLEIWSGVGLTMIELSNDIRLISKLGQSSKKRLLKEPTMLNISKFNHQYDNSLKQLKEIEANLKLIQHRIVERQFYRTTSLFMPTIGISLKECNLLLQKSVDTTNEYFLDTKPQSPEIRLQCHIDAMNELSIIVGALGKALCIFQQLMQDQIQDQLDGGDRDEY
jgi:hypothetical protein